MYEILEILKVLLDLLQNADDHTDRLILNLDDQFLISFWANFF